MNICVHVCQVGYTGRLYFFLNVAWVGKGWETFCVVGVYHTGDVVDSNL